MKNGRVGAPPPTDLSGIAAPVYAQRAGILGHLGDLPLPWAATFDSLLRYAPVASLLRYAPVAHPGLHICLTLESCAIARVFAPAHVALRAAFGRLPSQRPLACVRSRSVDSQDLPTCSSFGVALRQSMTYIVPDAAPSGLPCGSLSSAPPSLRFSTFPEGLDSPCGTLRLNDTQFGK